MDHQIPVAATVCTYLYTYKVLATEQERRLLFIIIIIIIFIILSVVGVGSFRIPSECRRRQI